MRREALLRSYPHVFAGALCCGIAAANAGRGSGIGIPLVALALACVGMARSREARCVAFALALAVAGWWWGSVRLDALDRSALLPQVGRTERARAVVTGPARRKRFAVRAPAQVRRFGAIVLREPALLELPPGRSPPQGAVLELLGEVKLPRGREGTFDERRWLRRRGMHVVLAAHWWRVVGRRGGFGGFADTLRRRIAGGMAPGLRGERRAVLAGVVLGEDEGLSEELRERFRASGLYHLLAVSGQNVAFVAGGVLLLAWVLGVPRVLGELGVLAAIAGYVVAVGWQPSVIRAGIAGSLASLAWLAARPRDRWYALLVGAAVLLAWNPYSALDPGFQLSFAAVAAIFLAVPVLRTRLEGYPVPRPLAIVVAVSLACGVATAPIVLLHFGAVPLYSILSNALAAPVVAPLLGMALAAAAIEPLVPSVAIALAWLNGWLAAYLATCARLVGGLPHAEISSQAFVLLLAALLATAVVSRLRPPRGRRAVALAAVAVIAIVAWRLRPQASLPPPAGLRITFLDVGQGDAVLLQTRDAALLVDQGPPEGEAAAQLRRLGVRRLAALVLTHPQRDHVGGAERVLERLAVGFVLDPRIATVSPEQREALSEARRRAVPVTVARAGDRYRLGRLRLRVLWPEGPGPPGDDPNNHALVLHVSYGNVDALLTADAESNVTLPLRPRPVEILKVAHHGSADDGLPALLELVRPRVAVISVGSGNDYGHPAPSTLAALEERPGLSVYRTDLDGRVVVDADGSRFSTWSER